MEDQQLLATAGNFAIAILLGALVGSSARSAKAKRRTPATSQACANCLSARRHGHARRPGVGLGVLTAAVLAYKQPLPSGLYAVAALAELTDVDDITLSMSEFAQ